MLDNIVVGGGIVGLSVARECLRQNPHKKLLIIEKESTLGQHQTGHNSGVIHSGIYYEPGSKKAHMCVAGHSEMLRYCDEKDIPYRLCGKVIVAVSEEELPRLHDLYEQGQRNGVLGLEMISAERLQEIEPAVAGIKAIWSPRTGVVDYRKVAAAYAEDIQSMGGEVVLGSTVLRMEDRKTSTVVHTTMGDYETQQVVTCAGLYSDHISQEKGAVRIIPFRGSYYTLQRPLADRINGLVYPVPDPRFPFLGVHFTRTMEDEVWVGPNAVLAFAREGYTRWKFDVGELAQTLSFPGFWKLARTYWKTGLSEIYRDFVKSAYARTAQVYLPQLTADDLLPGPAGVRAQALHVDGRLIRDFQFKRSGRVLHVQNAPSPAATASLIIGRTIVDALSDGSDK